MGQEDLHGHYKGKELLRANLELICLELICRNCMLTCTRERDNGTCATCGIGSLLDLHVPIILMLGDNYLFFTIFL